MKIPANRSYQLLYLAALAYFVFKLVRMYANSPRRADYIPARKMLTTFAVITIVLVLVTLVVAIMCTRNFGKGLKPHVTKNSRNFFGRKKSATSEDAWGYDSYGQAGYSGGKSSGDANMYMDSMQAHRVDHNQGYAGGGGGGGSRMTID